jgi:hypothetical protein
LSLCDVTVGSVSVFWRARPLSAITHKRTRFSA